MSFMDDLKRWAKGEDDDDEILEELEAVSAGPGRSRTVKTEEEKEAVLARIEERIAARAAAKKEKNYAEADRIRDELKAQGIEVTDIAGGAKWKRA